MNWANREGEDERLDALFRAYRAACPGPEPSAEFMPQLWQRIESRQTFSMFVGRIARRFVTAAVAMTLLMAAYLYFPRASAVFYTETYVEALAEGHAAETAGYFEPVSLDVEAAGRL